MGTIKTFLLGMGTAYAIYYLNKKRPDGSSLLEDMLDNPSLYLKKGQTGNLSRCRDNGE